MNPGGGWAMRPTEVAMEGGLMGEYSLVRFVSPISGDYQVDAHFSGIHFGLSSTDVHILKGRVSLFDATIDGYGGDPNFHPIQGASPNADYSAVIHLRAHEILTFAVGFGPNRTHFSDTTGLALTITELEK